MTKKKAGRGGARIGAGERAYGKSRTRSFRIPKDMEEACVREIKEVIQRYRRLIIQRKSLPSPP